MSERLVLTNSSLIDAVTPRVAAGASVTIEGDRIVEVLDGRRSPSTHGARVVDLRGGYLLPGLWDAHVHLEWPRVPLASVMVFKGGRLVADHRETGGGPRRVP